MIVILKIFTNNNNTFDFCWLKHHVHKIDQFLKYNLVRLCCFFMPNPLYQLEIRLKSCISKLKTCKILIK